MYFHSSKNILFYICQSFSFSIFSSSFSSKFLFFFCLSSMWPVLDANLVFSELKQSSLFYLSIILFFFFSYSFFLNIFLFLPVLYVARVRCYSCVFRTKTIFPISVIILFFYFSSSFSSRFLFFFCLSSMWPALDANLVFSKLKESG